jgi:PAS domain S-box-containing protein
VTAQAADPAPAPARDRAARAAGEAPGALSEERYRHVFEAAGVSIWEEDFTMVGAALEALRARGIADLRAHLAAHPEFVRWAIGLVRIVDVNPATLRLFGAREKSELMASLDLIFLPETESVFVEELLALWDGRRRLEAETALRTLGGERRDVMFTIAFPETAAGLSSVLVTLTDITWRKRAEEAMLRSERSLRALYRLASATGRAETLDDVCAAALDALIGALDADRAAVLLFDDDGVMRFKAWRGLSEAYRRATQGHSPWSRNELSPAPISVADAAADPRLAALKDTILGEGIRALAFIPLVYGGRLLGKFMVYFDRVREFAPGEIDLAQTIASHIAHAIDRKRAEAALRDSMAVVQIVNEGTPTLLYAKDRDGRMTMANPATLRALGVTAAEAIGYTALEYWKDKDGARRVMENDRRLMEGGESIAFEETVMLADGPHVFLSTKTPQRDAAGAVVGLVGASIDITDRKRAEDRQKLLMRELNHRVKNTLATVQSIAAQTLRNSEADRAARAAFEARLLALSNAHNVLTRESWDGAAIDEIVATALAPHRAAGDERVEIAGPPLRLNPKVALALAMSVHELATNAAKYGALSVRSGRVGVEWGTRAEAGDVYFWLRWSERGGPPVQPPPRKGFGSRLIERGLSLELGGRAEIGFHPGGLVYTIDAPLANLAGKRETET